MVLKVAVVLVVGAVQFLRAPPAGAVLPSGDLVHVPVE